MCINNPIQYPFQFDILSIFITFSTILIILQFNTRARLKRLAIDRPPNDAAGLVKRSIRLSQPSAVCVLV